MTEEMLLTIKDRIAELEAKMKRIGDVQNAIDELVVAKYKEHKLIGIVPMEDCLTKDWPDEVTVLAEDFFDDPELVEGLRVLLIRYRDNMKKDIEHYQPTKLIEE